MHTASMANKLQLAIAFVVVVVVLGAMAASAAAAVAPMLTMHNLCPYTVWPIVSPDSGSPPIADGIRLEGRGVGLRSLYLPAGFWSGRVVPRTWCRDGGRCDTGNAPPATVVRLSFNGAGGLAEYSVNLGEGFNVPTVVSPHAIGGGMCPALGCTADLNAGCAAGQRVYGGDTGGDVVACRGPASYFKQRCPLTRTGGGDVEPVPQHCISPGEIKLVFCQAAMVAGEPELIRTVDVADN